MPSPGTPIPASTAETTVLDLEGTAVPLRALWEERPTVLAFLRHFG